VGEEVAKAERGYLERNSSTTFDSSWWATKAGYSGSLMIIPATPSVRP